MVQLGTLAHYSCCLTFTSDDDRCAEYMRFEMARYMRFLFPRVLNVVNRCQTELQKSVGEPAQIRSLEAMDAKVALVAQSLHSVKDKLSSINSKFDALHMVMTLLSPPPFSV